LNHLGIEAFLVSRDLFTRPKKDVIVLRVMDTKLGEFKYEVQEIWEWKWLSARRYFPRALGPDRRSCLALLQPNGRAAEAGKIAEHQ
jgi:hypothetical protein